jgi:pimeloyl-ACP methyl ester carboxylesterase
MGIREFLGETRVAGELFAFAIDSLLNPDRLADKRPNPVILIPGFFAGDASLCPLARRLRMAGYHVVLSGIWCNAGCPAKTMARLEKRLYQANRSTGAKAVVIGHSLGGLYARRLGRVHPQLIARVILLGAPIRHPVANSNRLIRGLARLVRVAHRGCLRELGQPCRNCGIDPATDPPLIPETIIYTKSDGVVNWRSCLEDGPNVEAVSVRSSHCGLAVNVEAWQVIADRLENAPTPRRILWHHDGRSRLTGRFGLARANPPYLRLVKRPASAA